MNDNQEHLDERAQLLGVPAITHRRPATGETAVPCSIQHETEKAILVRIPNQGEDSNRAVDYWFPLSQVSYIFRKCGVARINTQYTDLVYVSTWLITKKGIEV